MLESTSERAFRNSLTDWVMRGGIALIFLLFGADKFPARPNAPWVVFFGQVGIGQWFRYFTGAVEMLGAALVLIPRTVTAGLAVLGCAMVSAILVLVLVIRQPADAFISFAFLCGFLAFWMRRRRDRKPAAAKRKPVGT